MQSTREGLLELPKAPSNDPSNEIATLIHGFVRDLARHVQGVPTENGLLQNIISQQEHLGAPSAVLRPTLALLKSTMRERGQSV